jgi:hypothetical protein
MEFETCTLVDSAEVLDSIISQHPLLATMSTKPWLGVAMTFSVHWQRQPCFVGFRCSVVYAIAPL